MKLEEEEEEREKEKENNMLRERYEKSSYSNHEIRFYKRKGQESSEER